MVMQQLPLPWPIFSTHYSKENWCDSPANHAACALLMRWSGWPGLAVGLIGPSGKILQTPCGLREVALLSQV
jgi:hypothetical protein